MVKKLSKAVDIINDLLYTEIEEKSVVPDTDYEKELIETMVILDCSLKEALNLDIITHVNTFHVVYITDYLEERLGDLNKVAYLMGVYTGRYSDLRLKPM
jgi:hypothetical protein